MHLLLTQWQPVRIEGRRLEPAEEQFAGSEIIRMRTGEDEWYSQILVQLHHGVGGGVLGIVVDDDGVLTPVDTFLIQL